MTRTHAVLWTVVLVATVLDILTTMVGLERGLREGNVVVRAAVEALGVPVIGMTVDLLGSIVEKTAGAVFWGALDFFNPMNYI